MKHRLLRTLDKLRLARLPFRLYELAKAFPPERKQVGHDGVPIPPPTMRVKVVGSSDLHWFLESGKLTAEMVREALVQFDVPVTGSLDLLDFGCGCGRVVRHWPSLGNAVVHGTDASRQLIRWCDKNLPFATFSTNDLAPPLKLEAERFDAAYAISVVTHLPDELTHAWLTELARLLRPGGVLVLTTHGEAYRERLTAEEREHYDAGRSVVRRHRVAGTNLCTAFHPPAFVKMEFGKHLELLAHRPQGGGKGTGNQDLVVLRRPTARTKSTNSRTSSILDAGRGPSAQADSRRRASPVELTRP